RGAGRAASHCSAARGDAAAAHRTRERCAGESAAALAERAGAGERRRRGGHRPRCAGGDRTRLPVGPARGGGTPRCGAGGRGDRSRRTRCRPTRLPGGGGGSGAAAGGAEGDHFWGEVRSAKTQISTSSSRLQTNLKRKRASLNLGFEICWLFGTWNLKLRFGAF